MFSLYSVPMLNYAGPCASSHQLCLFFIYQLYNYMKSSNWIAYFMFAAQTFFPITYGKTALSRRKTSELCLELHHTSRSLLNANQLSWNKHLRIQSKRIVKDVARHRASEKDILTVQGLQQSCAIFPFESWDGIRNKFASDMQQIKAMSSDWTYTTEVAQQYESVSMAIWWSHNQVGCAAKHHLMACCYDTQGNYLNQKIIIGNPVSNSYIQSGVPTTTPESNGNVNKNGGDGISNNSGGMVVTPAQPKVEPKKTGFWASLNPLNWF